MGPESPVETQPADAEETTDAGAQDGEVTVEMTQQQGFAAVPTQDSTSYASCSEVKAAGATSIFAGTPGAAKTWTSMGMGLRARSRACVGYGFMGENT